MAEQLLSAVCLPNPYHSNSFLISFAMIQASSKNHVGTGDDTLCGDVRYIEGVWPVRVASVLRIDADGHACGGLTTDASSKSRGVAALDVGRERHNSSIGASNKYSKAKLRS